MRPLCFSILFVCSTFVHGQSELTVQCNAGFDFASTAYTQVVLDGQIVEYNYCGTTPSFFLAVIDDNCTAWATSYDGVGLELCNVNNNGACRPRQEYHFQYHQGTLSDLECLDSLINFLPDNHAFVIYTPNSFDFDAVSTLYPQLGTTLTTNWGNAVIDAEMIILFGVKGYPGSHSMVPSVAGEDISFATTICPHAEQTVSIEKPENHFADLTIFPNPTHGTINITATSDQVLHYRVEDLYGRTLLSEKSFSQKTEIDLGDQAAGVYVVIVENENGQVVVRRVVKQ
jgi:hypothetical protein